MNSRKKNIERKKEKSRIEKKDKNNLNTRDQEMEYRKRRKKIEEYVNDA